MKNTKANTLRMREAIARFGQSVLHPLCAAALDFWQLDAEFLALTKRAKEAKELIDSVKQRRREAIALANSISEQKRKEVAQAAAILRKIDNELFSKVEKCYAAAVKLWSECDFNHKVAEVLFDRERTAYKGNNQAQKALERTRKRWDAVTNGKPLKASDGRALGILRMHREKLIKASWAKDGAAAGYYEAGRVGDRPSSDQALQGRLTAREIHSHLKAAEGADVAGDKDAKEIRRDAKKLGFLLAEDQPGRKWKPAVPKQKPKRPRGRPREKADLVYVDDIDRAHPRLRKHHVSTTGHVLSQSGWWRSGVKAGNTSYGGLSSWVKSARKDLAVIDREMEDLTLLRGGRRGKYCYEGGGAPPKRKPEGTIKGRSPAFAAFIDSD